MAVLTAAQIEELRAILRDASTAVGISTAGMEVPREEFQRLVDEGYLDPDALEDVTLDAFEFGRLMQRAPDSRKMSYNQFRRAVEREPAPLSDADRRAVEIARDRAGQYCVGLGTRFAGEVGNQVIRLSQELADEQRAGIRTAVADNIARRGTISQLKSELGRIADDWARDWHRIAITETHLAHQQGLFETVVDRHGESELLAKVPEDAACDDCRRLYLGPDGRPLVRPASWWLDQGVANVGLKRQEWKPVLGAMHPHCLLPGQMVQTRRGPVPIEDVSVGDEVLTHRLRWRRVVQTHRTFYDGLTVQLGGGLTVTSNHHVFLPNGAAKCADELGERVDLHAIGVGVDPEPHDCPAVGNQKVRFARVLLGLSRSGVPVSAIDLDGDLAWYIGEIDKITTHDCVGAEDDPSPNQLPVDPSLVVRMKPPGMSLQATDDLSIWDAPPAHRFMGRSGQTLSLSGACALHANLQGFRLRTLAKPAIFEALDDCAARHPELSGYLLYGEFVVEVHPDDSVNVKRDRSRHLPPVTIDSVNVNVTRDRYRGYVHNLSVDQDKSYVAEGLAVANCQCQLVHVPPGMGFDDEWDLLPEDMIDKSLAKSGPYIGPRGGKWADPEHTIPWKAPSRQDWKVEGPDDAGDLITSGEGKVWRVGKNGYLLVKRLKDTDPWWVGTVWVKEEHRRKGLAGALYDRAAEWASSRGGLHSGMIVGGDPPRKIWEKWVAQGKAERLPAGRYGRDRYRRIDIGHKDIEKARKLHYRTTFAGLPISIENRRGSYRNWYDKETETHGRTFMKLPYGYIRLTEGADGDHVDCFLGPDEDAPFVYVVHQLKAPAFREYDEDKTMLGFASAAEAKKAYLAHFDKPKFFGSMTTIPIERFRRKVLDGSYRDGDKIIKRRAAEGPLSRQLTIGGAGWEVAPRSKKGAERRKKAGGGFEYRYQTKRRIGPTTKSIAAVITTYINVSGGERRFFVPKEASGEATPLAGRNLGAQIVAHEVPKTPAGKRRFTTHARRAGLKLMVDSGEAGRFRAAMQLVGKDDPSSPEHARLRERAAPLDFDRIISDYEALAADMPAGTLLAVAPDKIADPQATAELRSQYADRMKALMAKGVDVMVPLQARNAEELGTDYARAATELGEGFIIGIPTAIKGLDMDQILPFMTKLYESGRYPKVHFLGLGAPRELASRAVQLMAAAYFTGRGVPRERVLELAKTPAAAARALAKVKGALDALSVGPAQLQLQGKVRDWAESKGIKGDLGRDEWMAFFADHPEDYDLAVTDKEAHFRALAARLVQADAQTVGQVQMRSRVHELETGKQVSVEEGAPHLVGVKKIERFPGTLDAYLRAKEHVFETVVPPYQSGYEGLIPAVAKSVADQLRAVVADWLTKAGEYGGVVGSPGGKERPIGGMSMHGDPVRSPGDDPYVAQMQEEHPGNEKQRAKRKKKRRHKEPAAKKKRMVEVGDSLRDVEGHARGREMYHTALLQDPDRNAERNHEWLANEAARREQVGRRSRKLSIRPGELR